MANIAIPQQGDAAASTSSGSTSGSDYDVFINHRGPDVKNTLASHLYRRLLDRGLRVFLDREELKKGQNNFSQIEQAISSASVHIAIFSPKYAQSSWCLRELVLMRNSGAVILPVFYKVDPSDLRWTAKKGPYAEALRNLEMKRTYDSETRVDKPRYSLDTIQNWRNALSYVADLTGFVLRDDDDEGKLLDDVMEGVLKNVSKPLAVRKQQIVEFAPSRGEVLLQPLPESGFVGSGVEAAHTQLITWLNEPNTQARVIGVYGMAGVGKTALLRRVYNSIQEKKEVSGIFDSVIWLTVSQKYEIKDLQASIAKKLHLDLEEFPDTDSRRMKLSASLGNKRFLLILDDVWRPIELDELGAKFGDHNQSKALISSRRRDVVERMAQNIEYCKMIQPLPEDDAWELFQRRALRSGSVQDNNLLAIAREVALECKGLPLAINAVAAALARKKTADEWSRALVMMKNADPSFPYTHEAIDGELYQRLRWSYNDLPNHSLKMCFLYCAAFPEDAEIEVERLVEMWTAERLVPQKVTTYFMDVGREHIDALVDRCLLEYVYANKGWIKVHDVLRDMAIYIGQGEEKWLFLPSKHLHDFPNDEDTTDLQRISLIHNDITDLPTEDMKFPTVVSLLLAKNPLQAIPERFLANFKCLKVLDLSHTKIEALPASVGELRQLQCLNLEWCNMLHDLPDSICNLSHLQFLNLDGCKSLNSIPDRIGELKNLKHLLLSSHVNCCIVIPHQIYQLTSLNKLVLPFDSTPLSAEDLSNLSNLIELNVAVEAEIKGVSMSTWSEMRILELWFHWRVGNRDDAALDILPRNMQSMKKLQSLSLHSYEGVSLPSCICHFQNLTYLTLFRCSELKVLPALEVGSDAASGGFPMLERLELYDLDSLESIVWNEGTMLKLQSLQIVRCQVLQTFQTEELPNLRSLKISRCDELKEWFIRSGGFPMLETLALFRLPNLESVAVRSSMWSEETMPKLERVGIHDCSLLRRLSMQNLPLVREIKISGCRELEVDIGNLPMLKTLDLHNLEKLESIARPSSVWNEKTMSKLRMLRITKCPLLRSLPVGMDTLPTLCLIVGKLDWWEEIIWEDENVKTRLSQLFLIEEDGYTSDEGNFSPFSIEEDGVTSDEESSQEEEIEEKEGVTSDEPLKKKRKTDVVTVQKAEAKATSISLLAKLHYGVAQFLEEAINLHKSSLADWNDISDRFRRFLFGCLVLHEARSHRYIASELKAAEHLGLALGVLRCAKSNFQGRLPGEDYWRQIFRQEIDALDQMLRKCEHENEFIWHDKLPSLDELPVLEGKKIVASIAYMPFGLDREFLFIM